MSSYYLSISLDHPSSRIFWPSHGRRPFETCQACGQGLMESGKPFLIEKAFCGEQTVLEYGMCWSCREECGSALSAISRQRITAHFEEHVDFDDRVERLLAKGRESVDPWLQQCVLTKGDRSQFEEYQITALLQEDRLMLGAMPIMLSSRGAERLQRLLSRHSRDVMDDFAEQVLGTPPGRRKSPSDFLY